MGFLVIYHAFHRQDLTRASRAMTAIAAGLMFASAVGLSIYVTFVFAAALAILVVLLALKRFYSEAAVIVLAGLVAIVVSVPYLLDLSGRSRTDSIATGGEGATGAGPVLELTVRPFLVPDLIIRAKWPERPWLVPVTDLVLLPLNYLLELGLFSMVGVVMVKKLRREGHLQLSDLCALTIGLTGVLMCSFLRSSVISNNDLGWRGFLVPQFILLIWGAELWNEGFFIRHARTGLVAAFLVFGIAGTVYELSMIRFYTLIADHFAVRDSPWFKADHHLGERTYALRGLYEALQRKLPVSAVLQHNPNQVLGDVFHGLYSDRQAAVETPACGYVFGGDPRLCETVMPAVSQMFDSSHPLTWTRVQGLCRDLSIDAVIVKDSDPIWNDKDSWMSVRQPAVANHYARAIPCGAR
jgi:hypothetical protein